jgi:5-methylcytosine-specific restriction endonuclease McrA
MTLTPINHLKSQRKTTNLGFNTIKTQDVCYARIEAQCPTSICINKTHEGERTLPVRNFYLNKRGLKLQAACITCQKNYRANRIKKSREKFQGKTKQEICDMYVKTYGETKTCSQCKKIKPPTDFLVSISMETGLHNCCILCSIENSQGNAGIRDFIFMPDKDKIKYKKKDTCEKCGGTHKLAIDHILPISKGGTDCISNKQTLCIHCNSRKKDKIDCDIKPEFLSKHFQDTSLDFTDNQSLSRILAKKVYEFKQTYIVNASLEEIRANAREYAIKYNIRRNLDRIISKIAFLFNKR